MHWIEFISRDFSLAMACVGRFWNFVVFIPIGICAGWAFLRVARENMQTTVQQPDTYAGVLLHDGLVLALAREDSACPLRTRTTLLR